jgi:hypothetical protein
VVARAKWLIGSSLADAATVSRRPPVAYGITLRAGGLIFFAEAVSGL